MTDLGAKLLEWLEMLNAETYPAYLDWLRGLDDDQFDFVGIVLDMAAGEISLPGQTEVAARQVAA